MRSLVLTIAPVRPAKSGAELRNLLHVEAAGRLGPVLAVSLSSGAVRSSDMAVLGTRDEAACWKGTAGAGALVGVTEDEAAAFARIVQSFRPTLVLVEGVQLCPLAVTQCGSVPIVLDMHNVESELALAQSRAEPWARPFRRRREFRRHRALAAAERAFVRRAAGIWVCSEEDRRRLAAVTGYEAAHIVPNGLPAAALDSPPRSRAEVAPKLVYIGHLGYRPNVWAVSELVERVLPALRRRLPEATLTLAGRSPSGRVRRLAAPGVTLIADPPSTASILAAADFTVIPLRTGGGTRIKILEAMAAGVIVVATGIAAEGLDLVPGEHFVRAETAEEMAAAVAALVADPVRAVAMRAAARAHVLARHSPEAIAEHVRLGLEAALRA